jgi:hypothetical protein
LSLSGGAAAIDCRPETTIRRIITGAQERRPHTNARGHSRFHCPPHDSIVNVGVAVGEDIAERDDPGMLTDARGSRSIGSFS